MRIQLSFGYSDEDTKNTYTASSDFEVYSEFETPLEAIGRQLNAFLRQVGYFRANDNIFMEDITDDEYEFLDNCLSEYRNGQKCERRCGCCMEE